MNAWITQSLGWVATAVFVAIGFGRRSLVSRASH